MEDLRMPREEMMLPRPRRMQKKENRGGSRQIHQTVANRVNNQFCCFVNAERIHDVGAMYGDGIHAEIQVGSNFLVGLPGYDMLENFQLAGRQSAPAFT